jgi:hypothetical protein
MNTYHGDAEHASFDSAQDERFLRIPLMVSLSNHAYSVPLR